MHFWNFWGDNYSQSKQILRLQKKIAQILHLTYSLTKGIQEPIIKALHLDELVDGYISSGEVRRGRPYPYMIHQLMERFSIASTKEVIKVGDSSNDILEGLHAGCLASIGVTTGAEDAEALYAAGAKMVIESVMDIHPVCEHTVAIQSIS